MKTSDAGIALIKRWEGERLTAYLCPAGVWTIGVGHTSAMGDPAPVSGMRITSEEASSILRRDLGRIEKDVDAAVTVPLNQRQFDTLVSFVFNVGISAFRKSTLLKKLNAGDYQAVPNELMKWTRVNGQLNQGLVNRRKAEADYWRGAPSDQKPEGIMPQAVDAPRKMRQSKEGNAALFTGGLASLTVANDISRQVKETGDTLTSLLDMLKNPAFLSMVAIALAAGAIWYWRKQRMDKDGY